MYFTVNNKKFKIKWSYTFDRSTRFTTCKLYEIDDDIFLRGVAVSQCSDKDQFEKKIGRKISLGRVLLAAFPDQKEIRRDIWNRYFFESKNRK